MVLLPVLSLIAAIWLLGLLGIFWLGATWLALVLYGLGSITLAALQTWRLGPQALLLWSPRWRRSLLLGLGVGALLGAAALLGQAAMVRPASTDPLLEVPELGWWGLVFGLPLLLLAEELLWRGLLLTGLLQIGLGPVAVMTLTTLGFSLNHLAVAPLPWPERWLLLLMALPIGLLNALLCLATGCLWGGVLTHALAMAVMLTMAL